MNSVQLTWHTSAYNRICIPSKVSASRFRGSESLSVSGEPVEERSDWEEAEESSTSMSPMSPRGSGMTLRSKGVLCMGDG